MGTWSLRVKHPYLAEARNNRAAELQVGVAFRERCSPSRALLGLASHVSNATYPNDPELLKPKLSPKLSDAGNITTD